MTTSVANGADALRVTGEAVDGLDRVLTPEARAFLVDLHQRFEPERRRLLALREEERAARARGEGLGLLEETREIRDGDWRVAEAPADLDDRRVEITGPVDRKMMINALSSGARAFMADVEDSLSPTWENVVAGQVNLRDAARGTLELTTPEGKEYRVAPDPATLLVRPRGWHLTERHVQVAGALLSASLFDFGLDFFHNARRRLDAGSGPYYYLPKLESHLEARLWNEVFVHAQEALGVPHGSVRATVLIETLPAAFQMEEILWQLKYHAAGLNAGRWDYIFSVIKCHEAHADAVLPDRAAITMRVPFMHAYSEALVAACHHRGAHAIGGMAAFIPDRRDPEVTERALAKVRADKEREADAGFDGTWVAHPDLVTPVLEIFDQRLGDRPHQKDRLREDVAVTAADLTTLDVPDGRITEGGVRTNISVTLRYLDAWFDGWGAAAIDHLMEDTATAEISRAQLWQWRKARVVLEEGENDGSGNYGGETFDAALYRKIRDEERAALGDGRGYLDEATELLDRLVLDEEMVPFLTLLAYPRLG